MSGKKQLEYLQSIPTGYITDAFRRLDLHGWMDGIEPIIRQDEHIAGRAVTVEYSYKRTQDRSNPTLYSIIRECGPGDVLVLGALGTKCWTLGENTAKAALYEDMEGIVIDGHIRDTGEIVDMEMPVFCRGSAVRPPSVERVNYNKKVLCSGAEVSPGDIIVGDSDGVVVIPDKTVDEVIRQIRDIAQWEQEQEKMIANHADLKELHSLLHEKHQVKE